MATRYRHSYITFLLRTAKKLVKFTSKQRRMSSLQELKVWVQAGQQNARKGQNLLHFLFKRDKKSRMGTGRKGGRKPSNKGHGTTGSATVEWTGRHQSHTTKQKWRKSNITGQKS